jgi:hypothetical protein
MLKNLDLTPQLPESIPTSEFEINLGVRHRSFADFCVLARDCGELTARFY